MKYIKSLIYVILIQFIFSAIVISHHPANTITIDQMWETQIDEQSREPIHLERKGWMLVPRNSFSKDKHNCYWETDVIQWCNPDTVQWIENISSESDKHLMYWIKDDKHVFLRGNLVPDWDPKSREPLIINQSYSAYPSSLGDGYALDKNNLYFWVKKVEW